MEQRQATEDHVARRRADETDHHVDVAAEVAVGELSALRGAGGAGRVEDHRGVGVVALDDIARWCVGGDARLEVAVDDFDDFGAGLGEPGGGLGGDATPDEADLGARVGEVEGHFPRLEQWVHRHDDPAGANDSVVDGRELDDVRQHDADPVAGHDAACLQRRGDPRAGVVELAVCDRAAVQPDGDAVAVLCGGAEESIGDVRHGVSFRGWMGSGRG